MMTKNVRQLTMANKYLLFLCALICTVTQNLKGQTKNRTCNLVVGFVNSTNPSCIGISDGTITLGTSGGLGTITYTWNPSVSSTNIATGLDTGTYTITVNDSLGCTATTNGTLNNPVPVQFTSTVTNVKCNGGSTGSINIIPSGGAPGYTYTWTPQVSNTQVATSLVAGSYSITINDSKNCPKVGIVTVTEPNMLQFSLVSISATCGLANGKAFIDHNGDTTSQYYGGTSPYSIYWNPTNQSNDTAKYLSQGTYAVNVYDANGCFATNFVNVGFIGMPFMTISETDVLCNGTNTGSATATVSSGTAPYNYTWSTSPTQSNSTATNLPAGIYTIQVKDNSGCTITGFADIKQPNAIINNFTMVPDSTNGLYYHFINSTNGNNLTYLWFFGDGDTSSLQTPTHLYNSAGTYTVKLIVNSTTCEDSISQIINVTPTGTLEKRNIIGSIRTYPNPFSDNTMFKIQANKLNEVYSFELTDVLGKNVKSINCFSEKQFIIDRNGLQNGIYFYKIISSEGVISYGKLEIQ